MVPLVTFLQANTGKLDIDGITPTAATLGALDDFACEGQADIQSMSLLYGAASNITCTGSFAFDQAAFELGPRQFQAVFGATTDLAAPAVSDVVAVTPSRIATLDAVVYQDTCTVPNKAGKAVVDWARRRNIICSLSSNTACSLTSTVTNTAHMIMTLAVQ